MTVTELKNVQVGGKQLEILVQALLGGWEQARVQSQPALAQAALAVQEEFVAEESETSATKKACVMA